LIRVIATADNHLNRYYARLTPSKLSQRRKYLRDGFRAVVDAAMAWPAHIVLIGGDLFDTSDPRNLERSFVAKCFDQLHAAGITICAVGGNHDTPRQTTEQGGYAPLDIYSSLGAIHYFQESAQISEIRREIDGITVAVGGLTPNPLWEPGTDPLATLAWHPQGADTAIFLSHGQIEGIVLPDNDGPVFAKATLRDRTDADLVVLGDIHHSQQVKLGDGRLVAIPGATERMDFGDNDDVPGYLRLTYTPATKWQAERVTLPSQPRRLITLHTSSLPTAAEADLPAYLIDRVLAVADAQTMVKLVIEGTIARDRFHALNLRRVADTLNAQIFQCMVDTRALFIADAAEAPQTPTQRGVRLSPPDEIRDYGAALVAEATDANDVAIIRAAMDRLLTHYQG
jgi:DNA repair protein SbcD/Mre11